jgi:hypothetical protein
MLTAGYLRDMARTRYASTSSLVGVTVRHEGAGLRRAQLPPANWFAPPDANGSGSGGNEAVELREFGPRWQSSHRRSNVSPIER